MKRNEKQEIKPSPGWSKRSAVESTFPAMLPESRQRPDGSSLRIDGGAFSAALNCANLVASVASERLQLFLLHLSSRC